MNRLHIFLPVKTALDVKKRAKKEGISVSELVRRIVQDYLTK